MSSFYIEKTGRFFDLVVTRACGHSNTFEYNNEIAAQQDAPGFARTRCLKCRTPTSMEQWQQKEAIRKLLG